MHTTARQDASSATVHIDTTLYDFIDAVSGKSAAEDKLLAALVSHMLATGQIKVSGDRRRLRQLLRDR